MLLSRNPMQILEGLLCFDHLDHMTSKDPMLGPRECNLLMT